MKISNIIKKPLILGQILFLISPHLSSATSIDIESQRYETLKNSQVLINDNRDVGMKEIEIEGNTMINLLDISNLPLIASTNSIQDDRYILDETTNGVGTPKSKGYLKAGTKYTAFSYVDVKNYVSSDSSSIVYPQLKIWYTDGTVGYQRSLDYVTGNGLYVSKISFTPTKDVEKVHLNIAGRQLSSVYIRLINAVLLEGDYDLNNFRWIDGIQSVGETDKGTNLAIRSENQAFNIFNRNVTFANNAKNPYIDDNVIEYDSSGNYTKIHYDAFYFEPGKKYTIAIRGNNSRILFYNNGRLKGTDVTSNNTTYRTFVAGDGDYTDFIENGETGVVRVRVDNVWIYEGEYDESKHVSNYEFNKVDIPLKEPLRGLSSGLKDRIVKKNGKWYIERNLAQVTFDGSPDEAWRIDGISKYMQLSILNAKPEAKAISDRLPNNIIGATKDSNPVGMGFVKSPTGIRVKPFSKDDMTLDEGIEWLKNNPLTVIYELANPVYEEIDKPLELYLYENLSYISNSSLVPAVMRVTVDRIVNKVEEYLGVAEKNPTIDNISLARMWINYMPESALKDVFQNELNLIKEKVLIDPIEKKTVTANIDVYIKYKNTLSLSMDTNMITFEDFSGVDDIEKQNAFNLTISSSLPYKVNAYLVSEIQNSDKSKTMDKSILNIKASKESSYKTFSDTVSPIVLLDNQINGNDISHGVDLKLKGGISHEKDIYKTVIKLEVLQK